MTEYLPYIGGAVASAMAWLLGKRKAKADAQKTELDSVEKAISIWRQLAQDFKKEVDELRVEIGELREENEKLSKEVNRLSKIITENGIDHE